MIIKCQESIKKTFFIALNFNALKQDDQIFNEKTFML